MIAKGNIEDFPDYITDTEVTTYDNARAFFSSIIDEAEEAYREAFNYNYNSSNVFNYQEQLYDFGEQGDYSLTNMTPPGIKGIVNFIDISDTKLQSLSHVLLNIIKYTSTFKCARNNLFALNVSNFVRLKELDCSVNKLTVKSFTGLPKLKTLIKLVCNNNNLEYLEIANLSMLNYVDYSLNGATQTQVNAVANVLAASNVKNGTLVILTQSLHPNTQMSTALNNLINKDWSIL